MNEFDQYMKHELKQKYYIRYADDFVILHEDKNMLMELLPKISNFLQEKLLLKLHPDKVFIKTFASGVDFLGWVHFPRYRVLRTATKRRMMKIIVTTQLEKLPAVLASYFGMLKHGSSQKLKEKIVESISKSL